LKGELPAAESTPSPTAYGGGCSGNPPLAGTSPPPWIREEYRSIGGGAAGHFRFLVDAAPQVPVGFPEIRILAQAPKKKKTEPGCVSGRKELLFAPSKGRVFVGRRRPSADPRRARMGGVAAPQPPPFRPAAMESHQGKKMGDVAIGWRPWRAPPRPTTWQPDFPRIGKSWPRASNRRHHPGTGPVNSRNARPRIIRGGPPRFPTLKNPSWGPPNSARQRPGPKFGRLPLLEWPPTAHHGARRSRGYTFGACPVSARPPPMNGRGEYVMFCGRAVPLLNLPPPCFRRGGVQENISAGQPSRNPQGPWNWDIDYESGLGPSTELVARRCQGAQIPLPGPAIKVGPLSGATFGVGRFGRSVFRAFSAAFLPARKGPCVDLLFRRRRLTAGNYRVAFPRSGRLWIWQKWRAPAPG